MVLVSNLLFYMFASKVLEDCLKGKKCCMISVCFQARVILNDCFDFTMVCQFCASYFKP